MCKTLISTRPKRNSSFLNIRYFIFCTLDNKVTVNLAVVLVAVEVVGAAVDATELMTLPGSPADLPGDEAAGGTLALPPGVEPPAGYFNRMSNIIIPPAY